MTAKQRNEILQKNISAKISEIIGVFEYYDGKQWPKDDVITEEQKKERKKYRDDINAQLGEVFLDRLEQEGISKEASGAVIQDYVLPFLRVKAKFTDVPREIPTEKEEGKEAEVIDLNGYAEAKKKAEEMNLYSASINALEGLKEDVELFRKMKPTEKEALIRTYLKERSVYEEVDRKMLDAMFTALIKEMPEELRKEFVQNLREVTIVEKQKRVQNI
jgi:hypothetical protein